jgi:hypothetical protein
VYLTEAFGNGIGVSRTPATAKRFVFLLGTEMEVPIRPN